MKRRVPKILFFILCIGMLTRSSAQEKEYNGLTITTQPVRAGQKIEIKIDPEKCGLISKGDSIYAVFFAYQSGKFKAYDAEVTACKKNYSTRFIIPDSTDAIAFKFLQGSRKACNDNKGYFLQVLDKNGSEQTGSLYSLYRLYSGEQQAGITKGNSELAKKYFRKWYELQDLSKMSYYDLMTTYVLLEDTASFLKHIEKISQAEGLSESQLSLCSFYAKSYGKDLTLDIENETKKRYPRGRWYWRKWIDSVKTLQSTPEKFAWIKAFLLAYPDHKEIAYSTADDMYFQVLVSAMRANDLNTFIYCSNILERNKDYHSNLFANYNRLLGQLLMKDMLLIAESFPLAEKALRHAYNKFLSGDGKMASQSFAMYREELKQTYLMHASMYGFYLYKLGRFDSATYYAKQAAEYFEWTNTAYNDRYFTAAENIRPPNETLELIKIAFKKETYTVNIKEIFLRIYRATGKADGEVVMQGLLATRKNILREELKKFMIATPAPSFIVKGLNGGEARLDALKGKVVLLDFWATWCGPCIASFPAMQELVDANKNNKGVAILFVDTWQKEPDKYEVVNNFFKQNPYRFDVYMDLDDKAVKDFKVSGIPTKIIIDKKGVIRFMSMGFYDDGQTGVEKLQTMIEMAAEM